VSPWGWSPERTRGIWRHGPLWLKPLVSLSPLATAVLCLMTMYVVGNSQTMAKGVLFDLPEAACLAGVPTPLVAVVVPIKNETAVFFDDARYLVDDRASIALLGSHLAERTARLQQKTLLVLADRRVPCGDLSRLASVARAGGIDRLLFANKQSGGRDE